MAQSRDGGGSGRERLLQVLEAYGADPARWPETEREGLKTLLAAGGLAAGDAVKAARELDSILAAATAPALDTEASRERLLARLHEQTASAPPPVDFDCHRREKAALRARRRLPWPAFGALAASLAAGLYVGAGGLAREFVPALLVGEVSEEELWSPAVSGDAALWAEGDES